MSDDSAAPTVWLQRRRDITVRHCGPSHFAIDEIARQAEADLGFGIDLLVEPADAVIDRAVNRPDTLDVFDLDHQAYQVVLPHGVLQGVPVERYQWWADTLALFTAGTDSEGRPLQRQGTLPFDVQYLEDPHQTTFATAPTDTLAQVPHVFNADSLGVRPDLIDEPVRSWARLVDRDLSGRVALVDIAVIGIMEAAMAFEAGGEIAYADKGNMSRSEIDRTIDRLTELKRSGHFYATWDSFEASAELLCSGKVALQSMWSPAITQVQARGIACDYPALQEGYRGWAAGLGLMRHLDGLRLEAAYEYLDWYGSGFVGALVARHGYYSSVPDTARRQLTGDEWRYWYQGQPAQGSITDRDGVVVARAGDVRPGGKLWDKLGHIACWNTLMAENDYLTDRWTAFLDA